jgi:transcriptional antiterminator RfaH
MRETIRKIATVHGRKASSASIRQVEIDDAAPAAIQPAPDIGSAQWVVAMTEPRSEAKAIEGLRRAGYPVFAPMTTTWRRRGYKQDKIASPLFPRYIFVGLIHGPQYPVSRCESVALVISDDRGPVSIPTRFIDALSAKMMAGCYDETMKSTERFKPGDPVTIAKGRFASIAGKIAGLNSEDRITVLISMFGSTRTVEIEPSNVCKVA